MRSKSVRRDALRGHTRAERDWIESVADAHFGLPAEDNDEAVTGPSRAPSTEPGTAM